MKTHRDPLLIMEVVNLLEIFSKLEVFEEPQTKERDIPLSQISVLKVKLEEVAHLIFQLMKLVLEKSAIQGHFLNQLKSAHSLQQNSNLI